jgi:hypothetical protein
MSAEMVLNNLRETTGLVAWRLPHNMAPALDMTKRYANMNITNDNLI